MAYSKTTWQNNVTDIDENNLNKIEQGIYDNSLVVEAVTNTLNPTDTETYKTAELTEGQITDVIGINDIVIKGQTSQNGEPTPSSPVDVNVVSGSNVINTSSKNLFIPTLEIDNISITQHNATVSLIKDEYTLIASDTDAYFGEVASVGDSYSKSKGIKIYRNGNTKLSFLVTNTAWNRTYISAYNSQGVSLGYTSFNGISGTYTFPENCEFVTIRTGINPAVSGTTYKTKVMVVYGDTIPTTYEPHQGKELPLDLLVGNLAYIEEKNKYRKYSTGAFQETPYFDSYIAKVIPNVTYSTKSLSETVDYSNLCYFDENMQYLSGETFSTEVRTRTFTTPANCGYVTIAVPHTITQFMLVKGTAENINPIELCKIGNYQDYFYKSGSKWYLHKEIGKVVLDGSESWTFSSWGSSSYKRCSLTLNDLITITPDNQMSLLYSSHFKAGIYSQGVLNTITSRYNNPQLNIFQDVATTNSEGWKAWLATNNVSVYYLLQTSTNTEITDTILISQLEAIYNAPLYEQTNITQTNNDLPMVLDITACKDNINGIKAFIRK